MKAKHKETKASKAFRVSFKKVLGRLKEPPELLARAGRILDLTEGAEGEVFRAADAEERAAQELDALGQEIMQDWARRQVEKASERAARENGEEKEEKADRRKCRSTAWKEARLSLARAPESVSAVFAVTLEGAEEAGRQLKALAELSGLKPKSRVHGLGDGAPWIAEQMGVQFGAQGSCPIDFYHLCGYLAAAAPSCSMTPQSLAGGTEGAVQVRTKQRGACRAQVARGAGRASGNPRARCLAPPLQPSWTVRLSVRNQSPFTHRFRGSRKRPSLPHPETPQTPSPAHGGAPRTPKPCSTSVPCAQTNDGSPIGTLYLFDIPRF